jgi:hypothetical protein
VTLIVVKPRLDESARSTRDFVSSGVAPAVQASFEAIDVLELPSGVNAFIRASNGRLMRLGEAPIQVRTSEPLFVRLQGPQHVLASVTSVQLNARTDDRSNIVVTLTETPSPRSRR